MSKFLNFFRKIVRGLKGSVKYLGGRYKTLKKIRDYKLFDKKLIFALSPKKIPSLEQMRLIDKVLSKKERALITIFSLIIFVSLAVLARNYYVAHREYKPTYGGTYIEGLIGSPRFINPLFSSANDVDTDISRLVFSGLLKNDPEEGLVPDLAESYTVSDDGKIYTFVLRENVKWHDGKSLSIDDVVFTFKSIQNADYASPMTRGFTGVEIKKVDDKTVQFILKEQFGAFLNTLTAGIIPEHVWVDITPFATKLSEFNLRPIGTGPFKFKSFVREKNGELKSYTLESSETYFAKAPYIKTITFKFYPTLDMAAEAFYRNEVDGLSFLSKSQDINKIKGIKYYSLNLPQYTAIFLNLKNDLLKDKNLRQVLAEAVNREKILIVALDGEGLIANGPIPKGFLGFDSEVKKYPYDQKAAEDGLERLGWKKVEGGNIRKKGDNELQINLTAPDIKEYTKVAEIVKENWEVVGIKVDLQVVPAAQIIQNIIKPRSYGALIYGEIVSAGLDLYPFWHSTQAEDPGLNLSGFQNREADRLLEKIRTIRNREEREKDLISLQNILAENLPAIFLYNPTYTYPVSEKVKGINVQKINTPSDRYINITDWYIKEKLGWKW